MQLPLTLSFYMGKQFLIWFGIVLAILAGVILLFDGVELVRRAATKEVPLAIVLEMALLRLPYMLQKILPFGVLIGGLLVFVRLTRSSELIVTRAAGVSAWQFLMPAVIVALLAGIVTITVINPVSAIMLKRFEQLEGRYISGASSMLSVSSSGLWLKERNTATHEKMIIHALRFSENSMELFETTIFILNEQNKFLRRIEAKRAQVIEEGQWELYDVLLTVPGQPAEHHDRYTLPIGVRLSQIQDSFAPPETISFWELPSFIATLKEAGFPAKRHVLHWHQVLLSPLFLCTMVLVAASFSLSLPRQGKTGILMMLGIFSGFMIYFISDLVSALGLSGSIPLALAAWAPIGISTVLGIALMLHLEDG